MELGEEYKSRLDHIKRQAENLWKGNKFPHYFFTPHDTEHSKGIIKMIGKILPNPQDSLKENEYFVLIAAAWLHDIGMIPGLFAGDPLDVKREEYLKIREKHHLRSQKYIINNNNQFGLTNDEAKIVGLLSKYHRRREDLSNLPQLHNVKLDLLAAYLRLADALHIDSSRVEDLESLYNLFLTEGIPLNSEFHWLRSFWIRDIEAIPSEATLKVHFDFSENEKIDGLQLLIENTISDLSEELDSCKDILVKHGISYYLDITYDLGMGIDERASAKLKQIISKLKAKHTASSSQLVNIVIDTIKYIIDSYNGKDIDKVRMIKRYRFSEIQNIRNNRPCHVLA